MSVQGPFRGKCTCGIEQVKQEGPLVIFFNPHHLLGDVLGGGTNPAHSQEDVLLQEVTSQDLTNIKTLFRTLDVHKTV